MEDHVLYAHAIVCEKCNYESNLIETLDMHIGKHHTDIKHFRSYSILETRDNGCGKCNFKSNSIETLDVHK